MAYSQQTQWTRERVELKQTIENLLRENTQTSETSKQWEEAFGKVSPTFLFMKITESTDDL